MGKEWFPVRKSPVEVEARGPVSQSEEIETEEGTMKAEAGDYIVRGVEGEVYPVKPDIFSKTYERIDQDTELALDPQELLLIVDELTNEQAALSQSKATDTDRTKPPGETLLDKISPDWREAETISEVTLRSVVVHRRAGNEEQQEHISEAN